MNFKKNIIYFLTENINSEKEQNEIEYLKLIGSVIVVSPVKGKIRIPNVKYIELTASTKKYIRLIVLWSKICYLLSRIGESQTDKRFDLRNLYTGNFLTRLIVNCIWRIKVLTKFNSILPRYDTVYFLPFKLMLGLRNKKPKSSKNNRVLVHDALILRITPFVSLITQARIWGWSTLGNVKSWDNPFYSQFCTSVNGYLVWGLSMWRDIQKVHKVEKKLIHSWGARSFFSYCQFAREYLVGFERQTPPKDGIFKIGYAAAFCDELMGKYEIAVILKIANSLKKNIPQAVIYVRPYPILPAHFYQDLEKHTNVRVVGIAGPVDIYLDGEKTFEFRKGNEKERCEYLAGCDCFLSIATSFTFEAAVFRLPIVHFNLMPEYCNVEAEREFFMRLAISDHLHYLTDSLPTSHGYDDLILKFKEVMISPKKFEINSVQLLEDIGIPQLNSSWTQGASMLKEELRRI